VLAVVSTPAELKYVATVLARVKVMMSPKALDTRAMLLPHMEYCDASLYV